MMEIPRLGNRNLIRAINRSIILNVIKTHGTIDRAQVARLTGLSPATVSGITAELIEADLILEKESGDSRGGRRPILLALNPSGKYVIGIKLMEDHAVGTLTDLEATPLAELSVSLADRRPQTAVRMLLEIIEKLLANSRLPRHKVLGVGIGLGGIIDWERGVLSWSYFSDWRNLALRDQLQQHLNMPVTIDNDVNTLTLAEQWFGSGQGVDNFVVVTVGRGVGMGLVTNGRLCRGAHGAAGDFGHVVVVPNGEICECGKRGCLETIVSEPGLLRQARYAVERGELPPLETVDELRNLAEQAHPIAQAIFAHAGETLGRAVGNLIHVLDPERLLISGEGVRLGRWLFDPMHSAIRSVVLPDLLAAVDIRIDPWSDEMWARGAASLVLHQLFESPVYDNSGSSAG